MEVIELSGSKCNNIGIYIYIYTRTGIRQIVIYYVYNITIRVCRKVVPEFNIVLKIHIGCVVYHKNIII